MSAVAKSSVPLLTIGEVRRRLAESGIARSATAIRRWEERGVVTPIRAVGHDRRLYTPDDVTALVIALRASDKAVDAV